MDLLFTIHPFIDIAPGKGNHCLDLWLFLRSECSGWRCAVKGPKLFGFILDGFPTTAGQAAEFEKFLTGYDFMFWQRHRAAASKLAPPPKPVRDYVATNS